MTGRKLYDKYCDSCAKSFNANRGAWNPAEKPLPAWPSLSNSRRSQWNGLARALVPKPRKASA